MTPFKPLIERLMALTDKTETCWIFTGSLDRYGYGKMKIGGRSGRTVGAHKISFEVHRGHIPDGAHVLHKCDNPSCVNPGHLYIGTHRENMADMKAKNRQARGERHGKWKPRIHAVAAFGH